MNLNSNPTVEQLRELLRRCDDSSGHHVLWVKRSGEVEVSSISRDKTLVGFEQAHPDLQMRCETFLAGNEYVGPDAADDDQWVSELFATLLKGWAEAKGKPEITCVDGF